MKALFIIFALLITTISFGQKTKAPKFVFPKQEKKVNPFDKEMDSLIANKHFNDSIMNQIVNPSIQIKHCLEMINFYRKESNLPPLKYNQTLSYGAFIEATYLAKNEVFTHDIPNSKYSNRYEVASKMYNDSITEDHMEGIASTPDEMFKIRKDCPKETAKMSKILRELGGVFLLLGSAGHRAALFFPTDDCIGIYIKDGMLVTIPGSIKKLNSIEFNQLFEKWNHVDKIGENNKKFESDWDSLFDKVLNNRPITFEDYKFSNYLVTRMKK